ncbi:MAG: hypothetical protein AAFY36_04050 [Bacteroidota bacterium]
MKALRYAFILLCLSFMANTASAQLMVGGGLGYGTEAEQIGIQGRVIYGFTENIRGEADFTYYFVEDPLNYSEFNINGNYIFSNTGTTLVYALAGLNFSTVGFDTGLGVNASATETGINLGAGANFAVGGGGTMIFGEARYVLSDLDQLVLAAGVLFSL